MEPIIITGQTLLALLGAIATVGAATAVITRWTSPYRELRKTVEKHTELLGKDLLRFECLEAEIRDRNEKINATLRILSKSMLAEMDNRITGNSIDKLREARNELQQFLIDN